MVLTPVYIEIKNFENQVKTLLINLFTLWNAIIFVLILSPIFLTIRIISRIKAKKYKKILEEQERHFKEEKIKQKRLEEEKAIKEESERVEFEKIQTDFLKKRYPVRKIRKTESNLNDEQKAYLKDSLEESEVRFLLTTGFVEVRNADLDGKKKDYLVLYDKNESPSHIICIQEVAEYLEKFTTDIETFRSVKPDIVFEVKGIEYAIEIETGKINNLERTKEKVRNLKKYYGKNWFFLVTDRNLRRYYKKLGVTYSKRNIKTKIMKIFKNSKKHSNLAVNYWGY